MVLGLTKGAYKNIGSLVFIPDITWLIFFKKKIYTYLSSQV